MVKVSVFISALSLFLYGCVNVENNDTQDHKIEDSLNRTKSAPILIELEKIACHPFLLDSSQHYRGLFAAKTTVCAAGSDGQVAEGVLIADSIVWLKQSNIDSLNLRDIEAVDGELMVLSIESPGIIKVSSKSKGKDAKSNWKTTYFNSDTNVFMDGMDFWHNGKGLVYGDPLNGFHFILKTENWGQDWLRIVSEKLPEPIEDEAGFAASGTGVVCVGDGVGYIGWGGVKTRIFKTIDYGENWIVQETPVAHGKAGKGIYCMAWKNEQEGVVAGGNWEEPEGDSCYAFTKDGGETWSLGSGGSGYRSGICHIGDEVYCSVGSNGTDLSFDGGATWVQINKMNMNAVACAADSRNIIAIGSRGKGFVLSY